MAVVFEFVDAVYSELSLAIRLRQLVDNYGRFASPTNYQVCAIKEAFRGLNPPCGINKRTLSFCARPIVLDLAVVLFLFASFVYRCKRNGDSVLQSDFSTGKSQYRKISVQQPTLKFETTDRLIARRELSFS